MNIPKAIEILELELSYGEGSHESDLENATKLGIEALKRIKIGRHLSYTYFGHLLPGETPN